MKKRELAVGRMRDNDVERGFVRGMSILWSMRYRSRRQVGSKRSVVEDANATE